MGKSRSATILVAYLLWASRQAPRSTPTTDNTTSLPPTPLSVIEALTLLRQGRPIAEPNEGFMDQLHMYVDMGCPTTLAEIESHALYRRFMNKRNVAEALACNQAPEVVDIRFEDEFDDTTSPSRTASSGLNRPTAEIAPGVHAPTGSPSPSAATNFQSLTQIRCRRCRHLLATTPHLQAHEPSHSDPGRQPCAHIFLHPLSWMRETLARGELDGRLACPYAKCGVNVGKFAWQGLRCSCGRWVTPGFGVARGRVDEIGGGAGAQGGGDREEKLDAAMDTPAAAGIRMPPGMRRGGGNL
jgi:dual specificity phosphatase 12